MFFLDNCGAYLHGKESLKYRVETVPSLSLPRSLISGERMLKIHTRTEPMCFGMSK
jgi:hypothetical protein